MLVCLRLLTVGGRICDNDTACRQNLDSKQNNSGTDSDCVELHHLPPTSVASVAPKQQLGACLQRSPNRAKLFLDGSRV
jgi:hypothetical protein